MTDLAEAGWPDEQVQELIRRARAGDDSARQLLVEGNLRLVRSIAQRFQGMGYEMEELFQVGCIGLLKAVDRFDLNYEVRFSTYAVPLILGEIRRFLRDEGPVHVSRSLKNLAGQARKASQELAMVLGREPTMLEIAEALGQSVDTVTEAFESTRPLASIHQVIHEGEGDPVYLVDRLADDTELEEESLDRVLVSQGLDQLPERLRAIVLMRFFRDQTQMEVAKQLGISQVQVSRLEHRALALLRQGMAEHNRKDAGAS
jgi:RNA polymerase sporulation-specific sigma factor